MGIPPHLRTLVAVPVLLRDTDDIAEQIERLEVHHLSSTGGAVHYALLSDAPGFRDRDRCRRMRR